MKKDDKLSWGVTLLFFGILFLLKGHLPSELQMALDIKNFPIFIGIIFLIFNDTRSIGITLLILGVFMHYDFVQKLLMSVSPSFAPYIFPALLVVLGAFFIFRRGK